MGTYSYDSYSIVHHVLVSGRGLWRGVLEVAAGATRWAGTTRPTARRLDVRALLAAGLRAGRGGPISRLAQAACYTGVTPTG